MADIELLIKIPEDEYNIAKYGQYGNINVDIVRKAIANGTPLPKGHGRLIDADELKKHKYHDNDKCENVVPIAQVDWQPTIIEADTESHNTEGMTKEEARARWICCPMCDKKKCEREADDCDVKIYLKNKAEMESEE